MCTSKFHERNFLGSKGKQGFKWNDAPRNRELHKLSKFGEILWLLVFLTSRYIVAAWNTHIFFQHQRNKLNCSPAMKCRIDLGAPLNAFLCLWVVEVHCKIPPFHTSSAKNLKCSCECWCYYSCILSMRIFSHTWHTFLGLNRLFSWSCALNVTIQPSSKVIL